MCIDYLYKERTQVIQKSKSLFQCILDRIVNEIKMHSKKSIQNKEPTKTKSASRKTKEIKHKSSTKKAPQKTEEISHSTTNYFENREISLVGNRIIANNDYDSDDSDEICIKPSKKAKSNAFDGQEKEISEIDQAFNNNKQGIEKNRKKLDAYRSKIKELKRNHNPDNSDEIEDLSWKSYELRQEIRREYGFLDTQSRAEFPKKSAVPKYRKTLEGFEKNERRGR